MATEEKIHPRFLTIGKTIMFFVLPLLVLAWTSVAAVSIYTLHLALLVFITVIALSFVKNERLAFAKTTLNTLLILLLVGGTGWFLSPFFFLLYLVPMYLGFLYTPAVAFGFLAALLVIFANSLGEVDLAFDIMTLLSLLLVIPLVVYLRRRYLILRQTTKDILILENDSGIKDTSTIGRLLANRVTSLGVNVRQPLTFIKQASTLVMQGTLTPEEIQTQMQRIRTTATETLDMIRSFEGETSANVVLRNKEDKTIRKP